MEARSDIAMSTRGDIEAGNFVEHSTDIERETLPTVAHFEKILQGERNDQNVANTDKWASSLEDILEDVPHYMCSQGHPGRISRIPETLRVIDRKSYEPCFISIGPYHHGRPSVQKMENKKLVTLKCFLQQRPELRLTDMLKEMRNIEPETRSFYSDVEMESKKFVEMMLLDSLYLLVVFCGVTGSKEHMSTEVMDMGDGSKHAHVMEMEDQEKDERSGDNKVKGLRWFWPLLVHDLFLLENQLPFFVLQKMHGLVYARSETHLIVTVKRMFRNLLLDYVKLDSELVIPPSEEVNHLLHLCHMFFRPTFVHDLTTDPFSESSHMFRLGSAVQLYKSGVRFEEKSCSSQKSLLDITFSSSGMLSIPCLQVDDNTNSLLRNLIALEQMKYPCMGLDVSAYAVLLLHLVTKPGDVKLLRRKGIIQHHLASDKEMVYLINRLSIGLAFDYTEDKYSLKSVFCELKRYTDNRVPQWRAWLKHKYFNNPWTAISLMAASLLLLLSALQTFYAVYSYYHPYFDGHS